MPDRMLEMQLDKLEEKGISRYQAVLMAAQEARFINDQIRLGIINSGDKPSSIALRRLFDGRVVQIDTEEETQ